MIVNIDFEILRRDYSIGWKGNYLYGVKCSWVVFIKYFGI